MKKNKIIFILLIIIFIVCLVFLIQRFCWRGCKTINYKIPISQGIEVVPTMNDKISLDTAWCGTFQLVWNDMVNELVRQDVEFSEQLEMVDNLNKQDFNENSISDSYYYKKFGVKTLDLKKEIEKGIKEKFNETSDVLDDIDWSQEELDQGDNSLDRRYIFYTMLKRDFNYRYKFTKLENGTFADEYEDVKYFGIDDTTNNKVRDQVKVLFYESEECFAVELETVEGDRVILSRGLENTTFNEIYDVIQEKAKSYDGKTYFDDEDTLKVPEISFNVKREYSELENKYFYSVDGEELQIAKAIQSIQMSMNEKGGSIKSEAVADVLLKSAIVRETEPRHFNFDDEYVVFLVEDGKEKPYFATYVTDITKFQ